MVCHDMVKDQCICQVLCTQHCKVCNDYTVRRFWGNDSEPHFLQRPRKCLDQKVRLQAVFLKSADSANCTIELAVFTRRLDATRGDLLCFGVSLLEDNTCRSTLSLGDRLGCDGDVERAASLSALCFTLARSTAQYTQACVVCVLHNP